MLKNLLFGLLFCTFSINSFAYENLLNNTSWYTGFSYHHPPLTALWWHTTGDTLIGGKNYVIVTNNLDTTYPFHKIPTEIYLREDSLAKKVFYLDSFLVEQIWYDFDLRIGDTVINSHGKQVIVIEIDSVSTPMGKRKRFIFKNRNINPGLIEGVGWEDGYNDFISFHYSNYNNWHVHLSSCMYKNSTQAWMFAPSQYAIKCESMCPSNGSADRLNTYKAYVCAGDSTTLKGPCDTNFYWTEANNPSVILSTADSIKVAPIANTSYVWVGSLKSDTADVIVLPRLSTSIDPIDTTYLNSLPYILNSGMPAGGYYFGNGVVNGKFDPSITGIGVHSVFYTLYDTLACSDTAEMKITVLNSLSLNSYIGDASFIVYPNPTGSQLHIFSQLFNFDKEVVRAVLYNVFGRKVKDTIFENGIVDLQGIDPGNYFIILFDNTGQLLHRQRIVKLQE